MIQSIGPITSLFEPKETELAGQAGGSFGDIFKMAIDAVKETDAEKTQLQYLMATGQLDNPAELSLAARSMSFL